MARQKVLVTGMSGLIGNVLRKELEGTHELRALNRRPVSGVECHQADLADLGAIQPAFAGIDTVVHLGAMAKADASWEEVLAPNIVGTYNVFEAARLAGVRRVIFGSSGGAISNYEREFPYSALTMGRYEEVATWSMVTHLTPPRPAGLYGCSKVWGETLARHYSDTYDLSAICVRIGHVCAEDRPSLPRHFSVWCSQRDIAQLFAKCIAAPAHLRFDVFYGVSDNRWRYRDLEHARLVLGYEPRDRAEDHR